MRFFRHALVAFLLLLAQSGALTHAVEHLRIDADTPASHGCTLCIAAHGVDAALASTPPDITPSAADFAPPASTVVAALHIPSISPRARAPPAA
jgi:hypothetical protein